MYYFEQDRPQTPNRKPQPPNPKSKKEIGKKETREKEMGVRGTEGEKEVPSLEHSSHSLHMGVLRVGGPVAMAAGEGLSGGRWRWRHGPRH